MDIKKDTYLWSYLSQGQKDLLEEGKFLLDDVIKHGNYSFKDYSFIVFPFAKAYEGFLKQILLDVKFISEADYTSDHFRLGKVLSPHLVRRLGERSVYKKICDSAGCNLAEMIWHAWKMGRNQVFHYFPHNLRSLDLPEAEEIVNTLVKTMETVVDRLKLHNLQQRLQSRLNAPLS